MRRAAVRGAGSARSASGEAPPHLDLQPRLAALLRAYGKERLMWGSDFPYVLTGGNDVTAAALPYAAAAALPARWSFVGDAEMALLRGGTAAALFRF